MQYIVVYPPLTAKRKSQDFLFVLWGVRTRERTLRILLYSYKESKFVCTKPRPEPDGWNDCISYWPPCWWLYLFFPRQGIPYSTRSIWMCPYTHGISICWIGMVSIMTCWIVPDQFWQASSWVLILILRTAAGGRMLIITLVCRWDFHMTTLAPLWQSREQA